jgi:2-oxoglutarate ferredoxin oxidoreductase subunit beta
MNVIPLTAKDFTSDQEVRWCPGCGDYAILKGVRTALAQIGRQPHDVVFISGIGCAARFPYYIASYGFHTIHGRAPAVATGVKLANPDLDVWVVGGDGDFLSIGGNHLLHVLRRDVDLNLLLLNNAIYGLTKGQYSPTSPIGTRSPSTPGGSIERPVNAALFALGAGASFVARTVDSMQDHMPGILVRAHAHRGASLVEILQNCIIYHDGAFGPLGEKATAADSGIRLVHGEPMLFGKSKEKGLVFDESACRFRVVGVGTDVPLDAIARHDETNLPRATALASLGAANEPTALGVLYARPADEVRPGFAKLQPTPAMTRDQLAALLAPRAGE